MKKLNDFLTYLLFDDLRWALLISTDLGPVFNRYWMNIKQRIQHLTWWMRVQTNGTRSSYSPIRSFDISRAGHLTHHVIHHVTNHVTKIIQSDSTKEHICTIFFSKCQLKIFQFIIYILIKYIIIWIINKIVKVKLCFRRIKYWR